MSMLTPAGFSRRPRRSFALRRAFAVLVVLLLLGGGAFASWWYLVRDEATTAAAGCPSPAATPAGGRPSGRATTPGKAPANRAVEKAAPKAPGFLPGTPVPATRVHVTVYNATDRTGLARRTTAALERRGFRVGIPANDPRGRKIAEPAEVRFGRAGAGAALRVAAQVAGAVPRVDRRADASVDLVLGDGFRGLRSVKQAAAAATPVASPKPARVPALAC